MSAGLLQSLQSVRANVYRMREGLYTPSKFKSHQWYHEQINILEIMPAWC